MVYDSDAIHALAYIQFTVELQCTYVKHNKINKKNSLFKFQDGNHPDEQCLHAVEEARATHLAVDSQHHMHNARLTGNTRHVNISSGGPQRAQQPAMPAGPEPVRLYDNDN
jgi:hypothetical protein